MEQLLRDPALLAVPFFVLFIGLELLALRVLETDEDAPRVGYSARDSATSLSMGLGSVVVNLGARTLALAGYTLLYAVLAVVEVRLFLRYVAHGAEPFHEPEQVREPDAPLQFSY